jgi:hypothetical protein
MNTSNRAIRAAAKAKTMRLNRWNKVPHNRSRWTLDQPCKPATQPRYRMSARKARAILAAGDKAHSFKGHSMLDAARAMTDYGAFALDTDAA